MKHRIALLGAVAVVVMLSACGNMEMKSPQVFMTGLGGKPAITAVVDDLSATLPAIVESTIDLPMRIFRT